MANVTKFWKIRAKGTPFFVVKSIRKSIWKLPNYQEGTRFHNEYAKLGNVGKTYSTLSGAMAMMAELAWIISKEEYYPQKEDQKARRAWVFETCSPYFELVEYEVKEVKIVTV